MPNKIGIATLKFRSIRVAEADVQEIMKRLNELMREDPGVLYELYQFMRGRRKMSADAKINYQASQILRKGEIAKQVVLSACIDCGEHLRLVNPRM
jgi:hypothetical protein